MTGWAFHNIGWIAEFRIEHSAIPVSVRPLILRTSNTKN